MSSMAGSRRYNVPNDPAPCPGINDPDGTAVITGLTYSFYAVPLAPEIVL